MAITLGFGPGNTSIVFGGHWNSQGYDPPLSWTSGIAGATELRAVVTIKPAATPSGNNILQQWALGHNNWSTFRILKNDPAIPGGLAFIVINGDGAFQYRLAETRYAALVPLQWNRIAVRWRGDTNAIEIWNNGVKLDCILNGAGPITALTNSPGAGGPAPFELGYQSWSDEDLVQGDYAEAAIWSSYGTDADMLQYGQGYSPNLLTATGRCEYVDGRTLGASWTEPYGSTPASTITGLWRGTTYGAGQAAPFGGVFGVFSLAPHPPVITSLTPGGVSTRHVNPPTHDDNARRPVRAFQRYEINGYPGKRSGDRLLVPSVYTLQNAMTSAKYGDDIVIDRMAAAPTGSFDMPDWSTKAVGPTTPRMPPKGARTLVTSPLRAFRSSRAPLSTVAPTARSNPPSYIRVRPDDAAFAQLRPITSRQIRHPDGWVTRVAHEDAQIGPADYVHMATIQGIGLYAPILVASTNTLSNPARWYFDGIQFRQNPDPSGSGGWPFELTGFNPEDQGVGPQKVMPHHLLFNRCAVEGDPLKLGGAYGVTMIASGSYIGWVNGYITDCHGTTGGESLTFNIKGDGPFCCENTRIRAPGSGFFTGGDFEVRVGLVVSDVAYWRNHQGPPREWQLSSVTPYGDAWVVQVSADAVTYVSGPGGAFQPGRDGPTWGGYMYEPATGKARRILSGVSGTMFVLDEVWPGAPTGNITVFLQNAALIHNSGLRHPLGQSTTSAASATMTFVEPLPASVEVGMRIYQNNCHWTGTGVFSQGVVNWGGVVDTPVPRRRITAIAGNRLSCTLDAAAGQSITTTYSVTWHDGIKRAASIKAPFETKSANRVDVAGNVFEYGMEGERMHPTNQVAGYFIGTMHLSMAAGTCTYVSGASWFVPPWLPPWIEGFRTKGRPWPYAIIAVGGNGYIFAWSVLIDQIITANPLSVTLVPGTNRVPFDEGDLTPVYLMLIQAPWATTIDHIWRYNTYDTIQLGMSIYSGGENMHEVTKGHSHSYHDNLHLRTGSLKLGNGGTLMMGFNMPTLASPADGSYSWGTSLPSAISNGMVHRRHNTTVHTTGARSGVHGFSILDPHDAGFAFMVKATDHQITDDIMDGFNAGNSAILAPHSVMHGTPADPYAAWDVATCGVNRNVYVGAKAAGAVTTSLFAIPFPDNVGVRSRALVGFHDPENADPTNPANYALDDISTTGTVEVSSDGFQVIRDGGGTFPALVTPGQFVRVGAHTAVRRIRTINGDGAMTANWSAHPPASPLQRVAGVVRATATLDVGYPGLYNLATRIETMPANQWAAVRLASYANSIHFFSVLLRFTAPNTRTGYEMQIDTNNSLYLYDMVAGTPTRLIRAGADLPQVGDTYLFEAVGTLLTASLIRNGVTTALASVTSSAYGGGRVGMQLYTNGLPDIEVDLFTAGDYSSPGVRRTLITDDFSTGRTQLTLESAYPNVPVVRGTTGNAYAVTFKGSGTDGTDPGANIPLLMQWQQGVRRA